jgi:predicted HicB family RNase H-like nuclease
MAQINQTEDKPDLMRAFTVRVPDELWEQASILAVKQRKSLNDVVTDAIEKHCEAHDV